MNNNNRIPVAVVQCEDYEADRVFESVRLLLETVGCRPSPGSRVLVKPNLLAPTPPDYLPCTHPSVVRATCLYLLDLGAKVRVGDSPTFGKGVEISAKIGLTEALSDLPVTIVNLNRPKSVRLSFGGRTAVSRVALENDLIVNVAKLKAHHQMRITGAVKNVYGCVTSLCKPMFHLMHGDWDSRFEKMILEIWQHLPENVSLMDAVRAMHVRGPTNGEPYSMSLLAASRSPVALDSAVMSILGLNHEDAPLWNAAVKLNVPGARPEELIFPLESLESFDARDFRTPDHLFPISFRPLKVLSHWMKRAAVR